MLDRSSKVNVVVYDISDVTNPVLDRLSDLDGYYSDARLIGDQLYVVSQLSVNRWGRIWEYMEEGEDLPVQDLLPTSFEVSKTDNTQKQNLKIAGRTYPYAVARQTVDCDDVLYVLPTDESVNNLNSLPTFTVVRSIDVDTSDNELKTTTMFGGSDTIHMSEDTLYVA